MLQRKRKEIKRVDPETGERSTAANAIPYSTYNARKPVDPETGEPSTAANAIPYSTYMNRKPVDPETGEPSTADNAIPYSTYMNRKPVDPETGEPSTADNAIPHNTYMNRKRVDPETGERSTAANAIPYNTYMNRKRVDPETGKPSTAANAIPYSTYKARKPVDPETGERSTAANAIPYSTYKTDKNKIWANKDMTEEVDFNQEQADKGEIVPTTLGELKKKIMEAKTGSAVNSRIAIEQSGPGRTQHTYGPKIKGPYRKHKTDKKEKERSTEKYTDQYSLEDETPKGLKNKRQSKTITMKSHGQTEINNSNDFYSPASYSYEQPYYQAIHAPASLPVADGGSSNYHQPFYNDPYFSSVDDRRQYPDHYPIQHYQSYYPAPQAPDFQDYQHAAPAYYPHHDYGYYNPLAHTPIQNTVMPSYDQHQHNRIYQVGPLPLADEPSSDQRPTRKRKTPAYPIATQGRQSPSQMRPTDIMIQQFPNDNLPLSPPQMMTTTPASHIDQCSSEEDKYQPKLKKKRTTETATTITSRIDIENSNANPSSLQPEQVSTTTQTAIFKPLEIKKEPAYSQPREEEYQPITALNMEDLEEVTNKLYGNTKQIDNCVPFFVGFHTYLMTSKKPTNAVQVTGIDLKQFDAEKKVISIKKEPGQKKQGSVHKEVSEYITDRNTSVGAFAPLGEELVSADFTQDQPIYKVRYNVDEYPQQGILIDEFNNFLKEEAQKSPDGFIWGTLVLAPWVEEDKEKKEKEDKLRGKSTFTHTVTYLSNGDKVVFVDPYLRDIGYESCLIDDLRKGYLFRGDPLATPENSYGRLTFFTPMGPKKTYQPTAKNTPLNPPQMMTTTSTFTQPEHYDEGTESEKQRDKKRRKIQADIVEQPVEFPLGQRGPSTNIILNLNAPRTTTTVPQPQQTMMNRNPSFSTDPYFSSWAYQYNSDHQLVQAHYQEPPYIQQNNQPRYDPNSTYRYHYQLPMTQTIPYAPTSTYPHQHNRLGEPTFQQPLTTTTRTIPLASSTDTYSQHDARNVNENTITPPSKLKYFKTSGLNTIFKSPQTIRQVQQPVLQKQGMESQSLVERKKKIELQIRKIDLAIRNHEAQISSLEDQDEDVLKTHKIMELDIKVKELENKKLPLGLALKKIQLELNQFQLDNISVLPPSKKGGL